ncbi:hypothetical protein GCM10023189_43680 [Nibrella saemangeumensis]|uniref:Thioredoxin domain-containing protein n=1 Tax=Nibrella saemangeumensis TaxID=1084526 RepID=A0ABP8NFE7_9BACT
MLLTGWATTGWAQTTEGFRIEGRIRGIQDKPCVLAHFYGATQYIPKDTARADAEGRMVFEGKKSLPGGLYLVVLPSGKYVEMIIGDQNFSFETDTTNLIGAMRVKGSRENELFFTYQQYLSQIFDEVQTLNEQKKAWADNTVIAKFDAQIDARQKEMQAFRDSFLLANKETFTARLLKATAEPKVPTAPKAKNGRPDSVWVFNYYKSHFWDDFYFSDERFVRTPILQKKLDRYMKELTVQSTDSLIKAADFVVTKAKANKDILAYTIWYITNQYEQPKVMGTDGLFVYMAEKYYLGGVMPIADPSTLDKVRERVSTMKPLLVGKVLPTPAVSDALRRPINLMNIKADYTVVFFYSPTCGHCKEATPKLKKFADANKAKGVEVFAIAIDESPEAWKKFVREYKIGSWINGFDYNTRVDYRRQFDVFSTPTVYILDKEKKIIARRLPVEQVEDFLSFYKKQQAEKMAAAKASRQ